MRRISIDPYRYRDQHYKWGSEYRIYFLKDQTIKNQLERYGCTVDDGDVRHRGTFRVNSRQLFETLVARDGFRLGQNF